MQPSRVAAKGASRDSMEARNRLQHLVLVDGRNDIVEFHFVGVGYEARQILLQEKLKFFNFKRI